MDLSHIPAIASSLAGNALVAFTVAVAIDNVLGVLIAIRAKTFDLKRLPSFLLSQYATKELGVVAVACLVAYVTGGDIKQVALATVTAGGSALALSVVADIRAKIVALAASAPEPQPPAAKLAA